MRAGSFVEGVAVTALAAGLTIALTYPIAPNIRSVARVDSGDGQWNIWNISWVARTVVREPHRLYDANIFHPHEKTLAYSENNFGAGTMVAPVYWASRDPILTHNVAVLLAFVLSFLATYALVRHLTGSAAAAVIPALLFAFCPYVFSRMAHIQLLYTAGFPICLLALHRYVERPTPRRAAWLAAALVATALTCGYYGLYAGLLVGLGVLFYATSRRRWLDVRYWAGVAGAAITSVLVMLVLFRPYLHMRARGFVRTLDDALMWAPTWRDYFVSSAWAHGWMLPYVDRWTEVLFPGYVALALGLTGAAIALRPRPALGPAVNRPPARETALFYLLVAVVAFWMSMGPAGGLYTAVYHLFPPLSFLRGVGRIGVLVSLSLAVLSAFAIERLIRARPRRVAAGLIAGLGLLAVLDLNTTPIGQTPVPPLPTAHRMLANLPRGPVAEVPFFWRPNQRYQQAQYMMWSAWHWQPLINGYSDNFPPGFTEAAQTIDTFPTAEAFEVLQERGARYVVVHLRLYDPAGRERVIEGLGAYRAFLQPLAREDDVWLFEILDFPGERVGEPGVGEQPPSRP
ncbi:hypothetical protein BH23ACI1_BH23ACI1_30970 [soil metagenome]